MKHLLYKEFKLSVHPLAYALITLLAMSALSPAFPTFVPLVYLGATYTFLFIGMNKSTTTNDLFYTCTLPIRREDAVKARILTVSLMQLFEILLVFGFFALSTFVFIDSAATSGKPISVAWLTLHQGIVLLAIYFISFAVYDIIYLPWFYRNGKSIILNMLTATIVTSAVSAGLTIGLYLSGAREAFTIGSENANYVLQVGILLISIGLWISSKALVIKWSTKNLKNLDF